MVSRAWGGFYHSWTHCPGLGAKPAGSTVASADIVSWLTALPPLLVLLPPPPSPLVLFTPPDPSPRAGRSPVPGELPAPRFLAVFGLPRSPTTRTATPPGPLHVAGSLAVLGLEFPHVQNKGPERRAGNPIPASTPRSHRPVSLQGTRAGLSPLGVCPRGWAGLSCVDPTPPRVLTGCLVTGAARTPGAQVPLRAQPSRLFALIPGRGPTVRPLSDLLL